MKAWLQNSQTYGLSFLSGWGTQAEVITKGGGPSLHCSWEPRKRQGQSKAA